MLIESAGSLNQFRAFRASLGAFYMQKRRAKMHVEGGVRTWCIGAFLGVSSLAQHAKPSSGFASWHQSGGLEPLAGLEKIGQFAAPSRANYVE